MAVSTVDTDQVRAKRVELIVRELESLPTLPVVATRLLKATALESTSLKEIVSLIESDQSLTAKILKLSRRAHLGLGNTVTTVDKAVVMMGLEAVRNAVLSIQVFEVFGPKSDRTGEDGFNRLEFWKHSLAVACAAQLIAEKLSQTEVDPDEAFVCGLLHDIGKVVFDHCLPKSFDRVVKVAETNRASIADVERRILGIDHAAIGKRLAEQWQLPESVIYSIWLHHHKSTMLPAHISHRSLVDILYLADLIAREQRIGFSGNFIFADRSDQMALALGISQEHYENILLELRKRMNQRAEMIGLDQLNTEELYQQALKLANAELGQLNQSMSAVNHQLTARSRYFDAINDLNRHLKPGTAVVEILEHIARSVRIALDLPSVIVYRADFEKRFLEATLAGESKTATELFELRSSGEPLSDTDKSGFLLDPPGYLEPVITHYARKLGPGNIKLVRLISADRPIGGILFACEDSLADHILNEKQEVESLTTACSLALGQSLILDAKERLADDLLAVNRQMHELEQKLLETRCMAALGELAAGAAHELNNPLAIISGRAQLLRDQEKEPETRKALDIVIEQTHNASEIISDLMEFAKPVKPQRQNIILPEMLRSVVDDFVHRRQLNPGQITVDIKEGVSTVYADQQQLGAIVKELLDNAFEASNAADLRIKIRSVAEEESRYIQIRVADNGPGMEPEVLDKAMDLFFSSRKAGRKRGVGLARAYRYAQANDGMFWLDSHLGMGTTAYIRLPSRPFGQNTADQ